MWRFALKLGLFRIPSEARAPLSEVRRLGTETSLIVRRETKRKFRPSKQGERTKTEEDLRSELFTRGSRRRKSGPVTKQQLIKPFIILPASQQLLYTQIAGVSVVAAAPAVRMLPIGC